MAGDFCYKHETYKEDGNCALCNPPQKLPNFDLLGRAIALLKEAEWAASIWTDTAVCPWCGGFKELEYNALTNPPCYEKGHAPDCSFTILIKTYEQNTDEFWEGKCAQ